MIRSCRWLIVFGALASPLAWAQQEDRPQLVVQTGHVQPIKFLVRASQGNYLATADGGFLSGNDAIVLWDTATGKELRRFHDVLSDSPSFIFGRQIADLTISPSGKLLASAFGSEGDRLMPNAVLIWEVETGRERLRNLSAPQIAQVAISPDDKLILTGGSDNIVRLWDLATGKELRRLPGQRGPIDAVAFAPSGKMVAASSRDGSVWLWETDTGKPLRRFDGAAAERPTAKFAPDRDLLLIYGGKGGVRIWDEAQQADALRSDKNATIVSADFSPDGKWLRMQDETGLTQIVNLGDKKVARLFQITPFAEGGLPPPAPAAPAPGAPARVPEPAIVPAGGVGWLAGGALAVHAAADRVDVIADPASPEAPRKVAILDLGDKATLSTFVGPSFVRVVGKNDWFSNNPQHLAFTNLTNPQAATPFPTARRFWSAVFRPDGSLVTATADGAATLWTDQPQALAKLEIKVDNQNLIRTTLAPDGNRVLLNASEIAAAPIGKPPRSIVSLWDVANQKAISRYYGSTGDFSTDGQRLIWALEEKQAMIVNAADGQDKVPLRGHTGDVMSTGFSLDGTRGVTGGADGTARLWDSRSGELLRTFRSDQQQVSAVGVSPDLRYVFGVGITETESDIKSSFQIWEAKTGTLFKKLNVGATEVATFSPDSQRLCIGASFGGNASLWEVATARKIATLETRAGMSSDARFSPDGKLLLTLGQRGTLQFWDARTGAPRGQLISFNDDNWVIADSAGHFDASPHAFASLHWVVNNASVPLDKFKDQYHQPGLLANILGLPSVAR